MSLSGSSGDLLGLITAAGGILILGLVLMHAWYRRAIAVAAGDFRLIAETTTDVILRLDLAGAYRYASPSASEILGFQPNELIGAEAVRFIHQQDAPEVARVLRALADGLDRAALTFRHRHCDGHWIWVDAGFRLIVVGDGARPQEIVGSLRDATERRSAEDRARKSEAGYRLLAENSRDMIARTALDGTCRFSSPGSRPVMGFEPDEVIGLDLRDFIHPDDRGTAAAAIQRLHDGAERVTMTYRTRHRDGHYRWVEARSRLVRDEVERPTEIVSAIRDISERKEAEVRWLDAIESINDGFVLFDADWRFVMCNTRHREMYPNSGDLFVPGATRQDILLTQARRGEYGPLKSPEEFVDEILAQCGETGATIEFRLRDGRWILGTDHRTAMGSWVGIRTDISEQKMREFDLNDSRDRLETQASELVMVAEALAVAKEAAERANRVKSEFLAVMSHEIRTPMNGVIGMNGLLLASPLTAKQRKYADSVQSSAQALMTIINDILDVSKLEAGKVELEIVDFSLAGLIEDALTLLTPRAREKGLEVFSTIHPGAAGLFSGDPTRLRQIVLNLLSNAIKFTDKGSVGIEASMAVAADGPAPVRIEVRDTGIGIDDAAKQRLFQPFAQADGSITRRFGGTGLGLNISRQLIELMGGTIGVNDRPGGGSIFWLELPLSPSAQQEGVGITVPEAALPIEPKPRGGRILLAEDNQINRDLATAILSEFGYEIDVAVDGREAVEAVQRHRYDLVLMDVQMPLLDGLEATRRIRAGGGPAASVPIIAMTADAMEGDRRRCLEAGMVDYVSKPIDPRALRASIERWITRGAAEPAPPPPEPENPHPDDGLDEAYLDQLQGLIPPATFASLVGVYLETSVARLEEMTRLFECQDFESLSRQAHDVISTSGNLGARRLQALGEAMRVACKSRDPARVEAVMAEIRAAMPVAAAQLHDRLAPHAAAPALEPVAL